MRRMDAGASSPAQALPLCPGDERMNVVERIAGSRPNKQRPTTCLNCAAPLSGPYCAQCGQKGEVHRSIRAFLADFVAGMVNFEGRLWHTLPLLAWKPGELTRRYVDGQRARFVSPIGLYLFTVFLMFAVLGFTGSLDHLTINKGFDQALTNNRQELAKLQQQRENAGKQGRGVAAYDRKIKETQAEIAELEQVQSGALFQSDPGDSKKVPPWLRDVTKRVASDPRGAARGVQDAASKYSWLLIPLSVPVMRLLFPLRRRRLYDHTVFVTYSLSFMMFLVIAGGLLVLAGAGSAVGWLALIPPWHLYRQMRGAYQLGRLDAAFRTFLLLNLASIVLVLWTVAIAALGLLE